MFAKSHCSRPQKWEVNLTRIGTLAQLTKRAVMTGKEKVNYINKIHAGGPR